MCPVCTLKYFGLVMKWKIAFPHIGAIFRAPRRDGTRSLLRDVAAVEVSCGWIHRTPATSPQFTHVDRADEAFPFGFEVASFHLKGSQAVWVHLP